MPPRIECKTWLSLLLWRIHRPTRCRTLGLAVLPFAAVVGDGAGIVTRGITLFSFTVLRKYPGNTRSTYRDPCIQRLVKAQLPAYCPLQPHNGPSCQYICRMANATKLVIYTRLCRLRLRHEHIVKPRPVPIGRLSFLPISQCVCRLALFRGLTETFTRLCHRWEQGAFRVLPSFWRRNNRIITSSIRLCAYQYATTATSS